MLTFILIILGGLLYLLPTFLAFGDDHPHAGGILVINLCFGWTGWGWAVSLAWAACAPKKAA